jgi:hypothetical protein
VTKRRKGKLVHCHLETGRKEPMFYVLDDGTIVTNLEGYAIVPRKKYEQLLKNQGVKT